MTWLRQEAARAALKVTHEHLDGPAYTEVADAIEAVAKKFAERALREVIYAHRHPNMSNYVAGASIPSFRGLFGLGYATLAEAQEHADFAIAAAIASAEKGEP